MKTLRDSSAREEITARVRNLPATCIRKWGRMEASRVLPHLSDQLRMTLGAVEVESARGPFRFGPLRFLIVHVLPWPKGKAQAPKEAFTTPPGKWEADKAALMDLIERFGITPASELKMLHPLFGRMTERDWGVLSYRHLDHHLRQFGA